MNTKRRVLIIALVVIALVVGIGFLASRNVSGIERWVMTIPPGAQTPNEQKSLASLEVINDHPFYEMTFLGDYPRYLDAKRRFYWVMGFPKPDCSSFAVLNPQGHALLAYNNDGESRPILLLWTRPPDGYASVSISAIGDGFPWFTKQFTPFDSASARSLLLYAPYATQTGMNEMGLAISTMTDPEGDWALDPEKPTLGAAEARRVVLDHAKDVDEAISLLSQNNVSYQGTSVSHLLLADRSGHSALLEWVDGQMKVLRNQQAWQVSTNFRVYGADETINADIGRLQAGEPIPDDSMGKRYWRYVTAWVALSDARGLFTPVQALDLLHTISVDFDNQGTRILTHYSAVYDLTTGQVQIVTDRAFDQPYTYQLAMK